ncbi:Eco57I restriction-modification methylase domain-containing protein [Brevibacterium aurantiacum]|uniref:site-specific DNA-methyltransferase (adenine-specific) n=1 Tax=Brevibacterium aurantiacum TaxID=273384 RepID=A0A3Q9NYL2_BREAU|nr:hypothetical protein [Brevibacterium aurantiacum]AZT97717.1 hypothetical protein CXR27_12465 [Brevibacterium aurantiacum]
MQLTSEKVVTWADVDAPVGLTPRKIYLGPDPYGLGGFQVAVADATSAPSHQVIRNLFLARKGKTQVQLVVAVVHDRVVYLFGPDPQAQPIGMPLDQAERQLQSVLSEPDVLAASDRYAGFRKTNDLIGVAGFTNSGLFASHHITSNVPKRSNWEALCIEADGMLNRRGRQLVKALGFGIEAGPNGTMLLSSGGHPPRAVAVLLDDSEQFDAKSQRFQLSPVAFGLAVASRQEVPWLVVLRKDQIRLYPGRDGVGVGSKGQAETFFEVDLSTIDSEFRALLPLVFSAGALALDGTADELLRDSSRYATELGARLRERIYDEVVPPVAVEVANRLAKHAEVVLDAGGLSLAYRVTLRILFRLLFQAYAEDRGLLPSGRNEGFDANSLKTNARRLIDSDSDTFGDSSTIWFDLVQVWNAIDQGNPQWQIPSYNGGLFSSDPGRSTEGALIKKIQLPDRVLGPALKSLLIDMTGDGVLGPVDFRSLSVREFGTIYEGLLESSLSLAREDLTIDNSGAWVPAKSSEEIDAPSGSVYFHSASGERKATGSYFTPKIVVDHLIELSIVPALTAHLEKIAAYLHKGEVSAAAREFFDFRVADLAMGSGHFLVAAVDKIEALMRTFLTEHSVPGVAEELLRLATVARDALGTDDVAKSEVDEVSLLRRQVARRCIYGLDINPMAVELARLALWIHTFVPGLPMSNLDHGLVNANSLTGIGTIDEALDALQPGRRPGEISLFDEIFTDQLASAKTLLVDVANASEANKAEVEEGARLLAEAREAADTARRIFDAAVAARTGEVDPGMIFDETSLLSVLKSPVIADVARRLQPAHLPYLFPEVFIRDRPGFDVLLGNPPWEAPHVKADRWWNLRFPGLLTLDDDEKARRVEELALTRPDQAVAFDLDADEADFFRAALLTLGLPGLGSGHVDLYQVFAWRNWQFLRSGGRAGVVFPRSAMSGSALAPWRKEILRDGGFPSVSFIENTARWAFDMEPRYTVALAVIARGQLDQVGFAGPFTNSKDFAAGASKVAQVPVEEFVSWTENAAFLMIPNAISVDVFRQMKRGTPFRSQARTWRLRPSRGDLLKLQNLSKGGVTTVEIRGGRSFDLWNPDAGPARAEVSENEFRDAYLAYLTTASRNKRSAHYGRSFDRSDLPIDQPRIALRWISRATDSRTCRAVLLPPGCATDDSASVMHRLAGTVRDEAFALGVLSSTPFDWQARLLTEMNLTFEVLNQLSLPDEDSSAVVVARVSEVAGRLAAVDDRFGDWAAEVGVPVGSVTAPAEKDDLIAELDGLVCLLYGLTEDQVEHVFATFHRGWNYAARLDAVLKHYRDWKGKA